MDLAPDVEVKETVPVKVERAVAHRSRGLMIPPRLIGSAQPGTILRLRREGEPGEQLVAVVGPIPNRQVGHGRGRSADTVSAAGQGE